MESENRDTLEDQEEGEATPICIQCMKPIDPLDYYCRHCGEASGQLTPCLPFVNIRLQVSFWARLWRQIWSSEVSIPARVFRFLLIIWSAPILLIGLLFLPNKKIENQPHRDTEE